MRLLKNMENFCSNIYSVKKAICNMNLSVLQELCILPVLFLYMNEMNQRQNSGEMK